MASIVITVDGVSALYVQRDYEERRPGNDEEPAWTCEHVMGARYFVPVRMRVTDPLVIDSLNAARDIVTAKIVDPTVPMF